MKIANITALLITCTTLIISGCKGQVIDKEFNREGEKLTVTVIYSNKIEEVAWKYEKGLMGQALYSPNDNICDIIINSKISKSEQQKTLGHEVMHCLYGDYHK